MAAQNSRVAGSDAPTWHAVGVPHFRSRSARAGVAIMAALTLAGCASNLECDGHACIGAWKQDMALGGTVVQCADGTWSHGGGLGEACAGHGGRRGARRR